MSEELNDAILVEDAISIEFASDPNARVSDWAARYPAQARTFALLATERTFPTHATEGSEQRVHTLGLSVLREKRLAYTAATLTSLKVAAEAKGYTPESLMATLQLPLGVFWKLQRRLIAFETIPQSLIRQLATALDRRVDELARYLRQPAQLATGASFRSDSAPEVLQESFESALHNDPETTDAMRAAWRG